MDWLGVYPWMDRASIVISRIEAIVIIIIFEDRVSLRPFVCTGLDFCMTMAAIRIRMVFLFLNLFTSFEVREEA